MISVLLKIAERKCFFLNVGTSKMCSFILSIKWSLFFVHIIVIGWKIAKWFFLFFSSCDSLKLARVPPFLSFSGQSLFSKHFLRDACQWWQYRSFENLGDSNLSQLITIELKFLPLKNKCRGRDSNRGPPVPTIDALDHLTIVVPSENDCLTFRRRRQPNQQLQKWDHPLPLMRSWHLESIL